jgi:Domain of unknown function DUF29
MNQKYEIDFYAWTTYQANLLRTREFPKLDIEHLIEEIESVGNSERNRFQSHLKVLLIHMLKAKHQPEKHSKSWDLSIKVADMESKYTLSRNPSLKPELKEILIKSYSLSRIHAAIQTGLEENVFPEECPWKIQEIFPDLEKKYW